MNDEQQGSNIPVKQLTIWQQNLNKSPQAQFNMLFNSDETHDILAMQEPNIDKFGNTKSIFKFHAIYPATHLDSEESRAKSRSVLMINRKLSTGLWKAIPIRHPDITTVQLTGVYGTL